jgi:hypothetical protein
MTESDWLINVARAALESHSQQFVLVRDGGIVARGADLQAALAAPAAPAKGCILYAFCEPTPLELGLAEAAGVKFIYCGISKHDGKKLGVYPEGYFQLKPIKIQRVREEIIEKWLPKW